MALLTLESDGTLKGLAVRILGGEIVNNVLTAQITPPPVSDPQGGYLLTVVVRIPDNTDVKTDSILSGTPDPQG